MRKVTFVALWVATSFVIALSGPFGTYQMRSISERMLYWLIALGAACGLALLVHFQIKRLMASLPALLSDCVIVFVFTATYGTGLWAFSRWWAGSAENLPISLWAFLGIVFLVTAILTVSRRVFFDPKPVEDPPPECTFINRLPADERAQIYAVCAKDHYVIVLTAIGQSQILMRFSDALNELQTLQGMQIHRSHWVAADAIVGHRRVQGRLMLRLKDGNEVPVSRGFRSQAESNLDIGPCLNDSVPA